jgi:hypothetical protein
MWNGPFSSFSFSQRFLFSGEQGWCYTGVKPTVPVGGETAMETSEIKDEWIVLGENDPPPDLSREDAAFERERPRLVREHLGKIALIHLDEVVGTYASVGEALKEGFRRFGYARLICRPITEKDEPEWVSNVDPNHPSIRWDHESPVKEHGQIHRTG